MSWKASLYQVAKRAQADNSPRKNLGMFYVLFQPCIIKPCFMIQQLWHPNLFSCSYFCNSLNLSSISHAGGACGALGVVWILHLLHRTLHFQSSGYINDLKMANRFLKFTLNGKDFSRSQKLLAKALLSLKEIFVFRQSSQ